MVGLGRQQNEKRQNVRVLLSLPSRIFRCCWEGLQAPVKNGGTVLGGQGEPPDSSARAEETVKLRYSGTISWS